MPNHFLKASRKPQATPGTLDSYYFFLETHIYPVLSKQKVADQVLPAHHEWALCPTAFLVQPPPKAVDGGLS